MLGILDVNGWHNLIHIATGLLGLAAAGYAARTYALALGLAYLLIAIWGFLEVENGFGAILDVIPVNTEDNFLHLILGLTGLAAGDVILVKASRGLALDTVAAALAAAQPTGPDNEQGEGSA